jgi:pSer/pThr/pTyr-binding forkhead associated (FHA) protein
VIAETRVLLVDRGSLNGTYVAGQRLLPDVPRLLRDGDEVTFGHDLQGHYLSSRSLLAALRSLPVAA